MEFFFLLQFFHNVGPYHIETSILIYSSNQWTDFYMIRTSVTKELSIFKILPKTSNSAFHNLWFSTKSETVAWKKKTDVYLLSCDIVLFTFEYIFILQKFDEFPIVFSVSPNPSQSSLHKKNELKDLWVSVRKSLKSLNCVSGQCSNFTPTETPENLWFLVFPKEFWPANQRRFVEISPPC